MRELVFSTRQEPGNLRYDLYCETNTPNTFHIIETYRDASALDTHRETMHYLAYREKTKDWLVKPPEVHILQGVDVSENR